MSTNDWTFTQQSSEFYDFDKELICLGDLGRTTLDMHLTFNSHTRTAYITLTYGSDHVDIDELPGQRDIDWDTAMVLIKDVPNVPTTLRAHHTLGS